MVNHFQNKAEQLLRNLINEFCDKQFHFDLNLKLYGSLHILADNQKVLTCLIDENLTKNKNASAVIVDNKKAEQQRQQAKHKRKRFTPRGLLNVPPNMSGSNVNVAKTTTEHGEQDDANSNDTTNHGASGTSSSSSGDYHSNTDYDDQELNNDGQHGRRVKMGDHDDDHNDDDDNSVDNGSERDDNDDDNNNDDDDDDDDDDEHGEAMREVQVKRNKRSHSPVDASVVRAGVTAPVSISLPSVASTTTATATVSAPNQQTSAINGLAALSQLSNVAAHQQMFYNRYLDELNLNAVNAAAAASNDLLYKQQLQYLAQNILTNVAQQQQQQQLHAVVAAAAAQQQHQQHHSNSVSPKTQQMIANKRNTVPINQ
jgi:hypothetical protein